MSILRHILEPEPVGPGGNDLAPKRRVAPALAGRRRARSFGGVVSALQRRPEIIGLIGLASLLNFWSLARNGWANTYYAAAVRSMSSSWHDFLYASFDRSGVMTIDKPPLAFWIQSLSVRVFGYHPLSILIPEALIGVASVVLLYDLVRRIFGRVAGSVAGFAFATTPITVAMSRHNNPDALLVLCMVAALWCFVRALQDGRTRWIVWAGVMVGLGFETKMLVALVVVPGMVLAWLWVGRRGVARSVRQIVAGGAAMFAVGGAWPLLVWLTPAADRPWISGTSDNSIFSLIFGYNGLGRVDGQSGGPGGIGGGGVFGGGTGVFRLLNDSLGGQDGWLLGVAILGGVAMLIASRARRPDPRTGWLIAVGGSFLATAVLFSIAKGIFHPYYVSLLAPFTAALIGASAGQLVSGKLGPRVVGVLVIAAGLVTELVVLGDYPGQLSALRPVLIAVTALAALGLLVTTDRRVRAVALAAAFATLLVAPTIWAFDTLGYATQSTFPAGGPEVANTAAGGGFGPAGRGFAGAGAGGFGGRRSAGGVPKGGFPAGGVPAGAGIPTAAGGGSPSASRSGVGSLFGNTGAGRGARRSARAGFGFGGGGFAAFAGGGGFGGGGIPSDVIAYAKAHGGGTIAVSAQGSDAATPIIDDDANVAGIGGFSGRESDPTISWFAQEVASGRIRWVYDDGTAGFGSPADDRPGATAVMDAAAKVCTAVSVSSTAGSSSATLYDCAGKAVALRALAA